jgi:hypothetical protein
MLALEGVLAPGEAEISPPICALCNLANQDPKMAGWTMSPASRNSHRECRAQRTPPQGHHNLLAQTMSSNSLVFVPFVDILQERHGRAVPWRSSNTGGTAQHSLLE